MISNLRPQKSLEKVKKCKKVKVKAFLVGGQTGEDCLPSLTDGLKSRVRHWLSREMEDEVHSSFFGNISSAIFLSENAFLRNIRKQAKKKKKGRRAWKIWLRRYRHWFARRAAKLPKTGLRWLQSSNYSNRKHWSAYKRRKIEWLALIFSKKAISNVGEKGK